MDPDFAIKEFRVQTVKSKSQSRWREEGIVKAKGSGG